MPLDETLPDCVDVLIIGSGFGGSVMAAELARARKTRKDGKPISICLVERGQAYPPGSFPRDPAGVSRNFWDPLAGLYGMFDVWSFDHMDAVISSGLGGGSLIYANVMLPKDETWFEQRVPGSNEVHEKWLITYENLKPHYEEVLEFLRVQELPHEPGIPKVFTLAKTTRFLQNSFKAVIPKPPKPATPPDGHSVAGRRPMTEETEELYEHSITEVADSGDFEGEVDYAPLAVRFRTADGRAATGAPLPKKESNPHSGVEYENIHGDVPRTTCTLIGECDLGCNQGAKNSLDHTYLSEASHNGVSIHTLTEAVGIALNVGDDDYRFLVEVQIHKVPDTEAVDEPETAQYAVSTVGQPVPEYGETDARRRGASEAIPADENAIAASKTMNIKEVRARRVVLAAGTLGSTFLLLRDGPNLGVSDPQSSEGSTPLGSRFSGNGDFLAFVHGVAGRLDATKGPVITAYRRYPADTDPIEDADSPDPGKDGRSSGRHGMYIQDAGYPAFAAWLVQLAQAGTMGGNALSVWLKRRVTRESDDGTPLAKDSNLSAEVHDILGGGEFSAKFMPLLGMGRDRPVGRFTLDAAKKILLCDWKIDPSEDFYDTMRLRMETIARGFKGSLFWNPLNRLFHRGITVHPIGGCPMDTNEFEGIVDTFGRVRGVPGLRVCDGSVFPGAIGPNPSLTIAAFAHRSAQNLLEDVAADPEPADECDLRRGCPPSEDVDCDE